MTSCCKVIKVLEKITQEHGTEVCSNIRYHTASLKLEANPFPVIMRVRSKLLLSINKSYFMVNLMAD